MWQGLPNPAGSVQSVAQYTERRGESMAIHLFRVIVPVADIDRAARFYAGLLGFDGERIAPERHYFDCGGTLLALVDPAGHNRAFQPNPDHIYFAVDDLEAYFTRAKQAGCS